MLETSFRALARIDVSNLNDSHPLIPPIVAVKVRKASADRRTPAPLTPAAEQAQQQHAKTVRFGWRIKKKLDQNILLRGAIDDHLKQLYDVELPEKREDYRRTLSEVYHYDLYCSEALKDELHDLAGLRYALTETYGCYAEFSGADKHDHGRRRLVPLTFWYSRHRLCFVWNMRKSQIIRNKYFHYLSEKRDEEGRLLITHYRPLHLTLTVPHADGLFKGQRFYARELIRLYAQLRKDPRWKQYVYAGEYGLEVKRGRSGNGLHIHIHSLVLQHPEYSIDEVRDFIVGVWRQLTANKTEYSGIHYETLYKWKKDEDGKKLSKQYIKPGQSGIEEYLNGVMECIKYHFKPDCLDQENGAGFDIPLIKDILENTKGLRMYSRFGAFYKESELNFNKLETEADELSEEQRKEEVMASSDGVEERLVDPRTWEKAKPGSYRLKVARPSALKYHPNLGDRPLEAYYNSRGKSPLWNAPEGLSLKEVIRLVAMGRVGEELRHSKRRGAKKVRLE